MTTDPHRFCWTIPGIHVAHCGGHRSYLNEDSYSPENNPGAETDLCKIWTARANNIGQWTSIYFRHEFKLFAKSNGIKHNRVAPYHPCSNGAAERFVQTFKMVMKKMGKERGDLNKKLKLANFLMMYQKMPQATTNETPSVLLMKRNPRSRLDLIRSDMRKIAENKQEVQKKNHDIHAKEKGFQKN